MTMTLDTGIEARLDRIDSQLQALIEESRRREAMRASMSELVSDLVPVGRQAMDQAARRLENMDLSEVGPALETIVGSLADLERSLKAIGPILELVDTASELGRPAMDSVTRSLSSLEDRGYFDFARSGVRVLDRVVTGFDEGDVEALGDNVVLILETLRDMTQPEVMQMLRRTLASVSVDEDVEPPGLFGLMRQLRKPEARRGLARLIHALDSLGMERAQNTQEVNR